MPENLFGTETPALPDLNDSVVYVLGTRIVPAVDGTFTHARWRFPGTLPAQPVTTGVWRVSDQVLLGSATFSSPTAGAWNQVAFSSPITVLGGVTYAVAVWTSTRYVATTSYPWPKTSGNLSAGTANGWLAIDPPSLQFPTVQSGNSASYFVDAVFEAAPTWTYGYDVRLG